MTRGQFLEMWDDAFGRCRHMPSRDAAREAARLVYTAILSKEKEEAEKKMPVDEAIAYLTPIYESARLDGYKAALGAVLDAARAQQETEKNEPLTLEEMRKMDGEPVYVVPQNGGYIADVTGWAKVNAKCERCEAPNLNFYFCEYVTYWLAYRHPPKEVNHG